jgi:hypothetical protein
MPKYWNEERTKLFDHQGREILVREGNFARLTQKKGDDLIVKIVEIGEYGIFAGVEPMNTAQGMEVMISRLTVLTSTEAAEAHKSIKAKFSKKKAYADEEPGEDNVEVEEKEDEPEIEPDDDDPRTI